MKITYKPLPENGEKIIKYGIAFERDQTVEVSDEKLARRLLTNVYFVESVDQDNKVIDSIPVYNSETDEYVLNVHPNNMETLIQETHKRKRRTKAEMEALRNGENQSTSSTPGTSDDAGS